MKRVRYFLLKWFGIDWWEYLGYGTNPEDGLCGSHIMDVRRSRITGNMEQLYFSGAAGPVGWMPIYEEFKEQIEQIEND